MNVVCNPADASGRDTILFGNSAQEWPEPFPQLRVQHRDTLFGAENTMNIERAKGVCYGGLSRISTFTIRFFLRYYGCLMPSLAHCPSSRSAPIPNRRRRGRL